MGADGRQCDEEERQLWEEDDKKELVNAFKISLQHWYWDNIRYTRNKINVSSITTAVTIENNAYTNTEHSKTVE